MRNANHRVGPCLLSMMLLAACGGNSGDGSGNNPPPPVPPPVADAIALTPAFEQLQFAAPVLLLQAPGDDSRWFVVEQGGTVRVFDNAADVASADVFADLSSQVDAGAPEAGLLGMAFHPEFSTNGEVYFSYTRTGSPFDSVIARYTLDSNGVVESGSEEALLVVPQDASNHNGGHIAFGPDGLLYAGFGDGGGAGDPNDRGQTTTNLMGAILRIDVGVPVGYGIPAGNPFAGNTECATGFGSSDCPEIFAWGFRNPWRFSFDRTTGQLWVGDVGQNSWEEVSRVEGGLNYGWRQREGAHCFNPSTGCRTDSVDPITEYGRAVGRSVTGGHVYRGSQYPDIRGDYLFADFVTGVILSVPHTAQQGTDPEQRLDSELNIASFGESNAGELYVLDYSSGSIYAVVAL